MSCVFGTEFGPTIAEPILMRLSRARRVPGLVMLSCVVAGLIGADDPADSALREKGLRRSGTTYVLAGEAEVQKKLSDARANSRQVTAALARQAAYDQSLRESKQAIRELTEQRIALNQQLAQATSPAQHNQLAFLYNGAGDQLNLLHQQQQDTETKGKIDAEAATRRESYIQQVLDLRQLVDTVTHDYAILAEDDAVKQTLEQLNQKAKAKVTLGPSRSFLANVALLAKVESTVLSESVDLRKEGGIFWVDVTFNGKTTLPMAFDTGAADVVLPASFAAKVGLVPGPDDPVVRCQVADGSIIEARRMTVPSMRVGQFTVKDVSCTVMPANKKDVPPLLGQSFQKNFLLRFSPDSGKLGLSRIETPEAERPAPRAKSSTNRNPRSSGSKNERPDASDRR